MRHLGRLGLLQPLFLPLSQGGRDVAAPLTFIIAVIALGEAAEMGDKGIPIRQTVGADVIYNAGGQDLLGAAAADAEEEFDGGAIDEGTGQGLQLVDHVVDFAVPDRFCGHGYFTMLVRTGAKYKHSRKNDKDHYPAFVISFPQ
jgi:hypothetical protein